MTSPGIHAARGAVDAARAALGAMISADGPSGTSAVPFSGGTATAVPASDARAIAARAEQGWSSAEYVLQMLTGRDDLVGQSVIAEARRQQRLALSDAHALAALHSWAARAASGTQEARADAERAIAREALDAIEHAIASGGLPGDGPADGAAAYIDNMAALGATPRETASSDWTRSAPPAGAATAETKTVTIARGNRSRLVTMAGAAVLLVLLAVGGWYIYNERSIDSMYRDAVTAYQRGAVETARQAFARVAQQRPNDPRPLIFLGRIEREQRNVAASRRFLEGAIRIAPNNALAQREFAATMLADNQPELARRFYVRAIALDPNDRNAQGFLGCALVRLNRFDEARRWFDRAGQGEWMGCAMGLPAPVYGPYPPAPQGYPQQQYPVPPPPR